MGGSLTALTNQTRGYTVNEETLDLDAIYKTALPESHLAGLQAVYNAALAQASAAFLAAQPTPAPAPTEP